MVNPNTKRSGTKSKSNARLSTPTHKTKLELPESLLTTSTLSSKSTTASMKKAITKMDLGKELANTSDDSVADELDWSTIDWNSKRSVLAAVKILYKDDCDEDDINELTYDQCIDELFASITSIDVWKAKYQEMGVMRGMDYRTMVNRTSTMKRMSKDKRAQAVRNLVKEINAKIEFVNDGGTYNQREQITSVQSNKLKNHKPSDNNDEHTASCTSDEDSDCHEPSLTVKKVYDETGNVSGDEKKAAKRNENGDSKEEQDQKGEHSVLKQMKRDGGKGSGSRKTKKQMINEINSLKQMLLNATEKLEEAEESSEDESDSKPKKPSSKNVIIKKEPGIKDEDTESDNEDKASAFEAVKSNIKIKEEPYDDANTSVLTDATNESSKDRRTTGHKSSKRKVGPHQDYEGVHDVQDKSLGGTPKKSKKEEHKRPVKKESNSDSESDLEISDLLNLSETASKTNSAKKMNVFVSSPFYGRVVGRKQKCVAVFMENKPMLWYLKPLFLRWYLDSLSAKRKRSERQDWEMKWKDTVEEFYARKNPSPDDTLARTRGNKAVTHISFIVKMPEDTDIEDEVKKVMKAFKSCFNRKPGKECHCGVKFLSLLMENNMEGLHNNLLQSMSDGTEIQPAADAISIELDKYIGHSDLLQFEWDTPLDKMWTNYDIKRFLMTHIGVTGWDKMSVDEKRACFRNYVPNQASGIIPDWGAMIKRQWNDGL